MVIALEVLPQLNVMLDRSDLEAYALVREAAAQPGVSLREAVEHSTVLDRLADQSQVETMRAELDAIPEEVGRTIVEAVQEACAADRVVRIDWEEIDPGVSMSAEVDHGATAGADADAGAEAVTRIIVRTPHGRHFEH